MGEQEEMLKKKDADEEQKKEELRVKAAQELADWYKQYEEQLAKTRKANKEQEEAVTAGTEVNGIVPGQEWERVSKHCDFSAKAPGHTKDVSRMRSILLQLSRARPPQESEETYLHLCRRGAFTTSAL